MTKQSLQRQFDKLLSITKVQSARISDLETLNAIICAKLKLTPRPRTVGPDDIPLKMAAGELGMTIAGVRYHCKKGKLRRIEVGDRVFIDRKTIDAFKKMIPSYSARVSRSMR
jgi:hypothetical protein